MRLGGYEVIKLPLLVLRAMGLEAIGKSVIYLIYLGSGFNKGGLKAQWSTQPRASEATPWGVRIVESPRPERAKALTLYVVILT